MRKSFWIVLATVLVALVSAGCAKEFDDSEIWGKISDLDQRLTALEQTVKTLNEKTIPGLQTIIDALVEKDPVVSVTKTDEGALITFYSGKTAVVPIDKGDPGESPVMGVKLVDGVYCWTVNGELIKDADGKPVPVNGKDGANPYFRTNDGALEYSIDGVNWVPVPAVGTPAAVVTVDETDESVIITSGSTTIVLSKELPFSIKFSIPDDLSILMGETGYVGYTLTGVREDDITEVGILTATPGFEAEAEPYSGQNDAGIISIKNNSENANQTHKVYVFAANGKGQTDIKGLSFASSTLKAVLSVQMAPAAGGTDVVLNVKANEDYDVIVSADATWIHVTPPTRALYEDALAVTVDENTTNAYRSGEITLMAKDGVTILDQIDLLQAPASTVATSLASVGILPDGTKVTVYKISVVAASDAKAIITDGVSMMYVNAKGLYEGVFDFTGVKKTDESGLPFIEVSSLNMLLGETPIVPDKHENFTYYAAADNGYSYFFTVINGELKKQGGAFVVTDPYGAVDVVIEDAPEELGLSSLVDKLVALKAWVINPVEEGEKLILPAIATSVNEIVFTEEPGWALSYNEVEGEDIISVASSVAPEADHYYSYCMPESEIIDNFDSVDGFLAPYSLSLADDLYYYFFYYGLFGYDYDEVYEGFIYSGNTDESYELDYGKHYIIVLGFDDDAALTGKYAIKEIEKVSPYAFNKYEDYIGQYTFTNSAGAEEVWTLSPKVEGQSYTISGLCGVDQEYIPGGQLAEAEFNSVTGLVTISNQTLGTWTEGSYTLIDKLVAVWYSGTKVYSNENYMDDPLILSFGFNEAGSVDLFIESDSYGPLEGIGYLYDVQGTTSFGVIANTKFAGAKLIKGIVETTTVYEDFIGSWNQSATVVWKITEKVAGESYNITGIAGQGNLPAVEAVFEGGKMKVSETGFGTDQSLSGIFVYGGKSYINYPTNGEPAVLFIASINEDGNIDVKPGSCSYGDFTSFIFLDGNDQSGITSMPFQLTPYDPSVQFDPLQYEYTSSDFTDGITMSVLTGTDWDVYAIPGDGTEWYEENRVYLGKAKATDIEDDGSGDDLITISGFGYVYPDIYGFDDSVVFDLYYGTLYSHPTTNGSFDLDGTPIYVATSNIDADYEDYTSNYTTMARFVGEGIIAFVTNSSSYNIDGFLFNAYSDASCTELFSPIWAERSILLVDPSVYATPNEVSAATSSFRKSSVKANGVKKVNAKKAENVKKVLPTSAKRFSVISRPPVQQAKSNGSRFMSKAEMHQNRSAKKF